VFDGFIFSFLGLGGQNIVEPKFEVQDFWENLYYDDHGVLFCTYERYKNVEKRQNSTTEMRYAVIMAKMSKKGLKSLQKIIFFQNYF